jgi:hypothetical protein
MTIIVLTHDPGRDKPCPYEKNQPLIPFLLVNLIQTIRS